MKKFITTMITMIILLLSMTVSVFAWFTDKQGKADANGLEAKFDVNYNFDFDTNYDMLLDATRFEDLIYLTNNDLAKGPVTDFGGLSTNISITIKNPKRDKFKIYVGSDVDASLESGPYNGIRNSLLYLVYSEADVVKAVSASKDPVEYIMETEIFNFDRTNLTEEQYINKVVSNLRTRNGINILGNKDSETMFIAAWGYYDGLKGQTYNSIDLQSVYYSLVYRVTFLLRGALI